jgi:hypothetical protein
VIKAAKPACFIEEVMPVAVQLHGVYLEKPGKKELV